MKFFILSLLLLSSSFANTLKCSYLNLEYYSFNILYSQGGQQLKVTSPKIYSTMDGYERYYDYNKVTSVQSMAASSFNIDLDDPQPLIFDFEIDKISIRAKVLFTAEILQPGCHNLKYKYELEIPSRNKTITRNATLDVNGLGCAPKRKKTFESLFNKSRYIYAPMDTRTVQSSLIDKKQEFGVLTQISTHYDRGGVFRRPSTTKEKTFAFPSRLFFSCEQIVGVPKAPTPISY